MNDDGCPFDAEVHPKVRRGVRQGQLEHNPGLRILQRPQPCQGQLRALGAAHSSAEVGGGWGPEVLHPTMHRWVQTLAASVANRMTFG